MIVDNSEEFRSALELTLSGEYQVYPFRDGLAAQEAVSSIKPDVVILDLMLPGIDGLSLLHSIRNEGFRPMVLVTTRLINDYITDSADELGIEYVMLKPCDPAVAAERVRHISRRLNPKPEETVDPYAYITEVLNKLSFSPRHRGYAYLREAVIKMHQSPDISVTKELYPHIGGHFGSTAFQVERAIRTAIHAALAADQNNSWKDYITYDMNGIPAHPSNGFLIARLAEELRIKTGIQ